MALCNNGITGSAMLQNGITRDMFLVSCNGDLHQIRHLVITGFSLLGRGKISYHKKDILAPDIRMVREKAIIGINKQMREEGMRIIDIILAFSISDDVKFQHSAYHALKDYIFLIHDNECCDTKIAEDMI